MVGRLLAGALSLGPLVFLTACDRIVQPTNSIGDSSVVLVDARLEPGTGVCANDLVYRSNATLYLYFDNLLAPAGCPSEVAVFSEGDAMAIAENVTLWTDKDGDELRVDLAPKLDVPVTFFLAVPDLMAKLAWGDVVEKIAADDRDEANEIYDENKTGISFGMDARKLSAADAIRIMLLLPLAIVEALLSGFDPASFVCNIPSSFEAAGYYVPDRLNVYYLPVPGTGMMCPDDRNVVFIALDKKQATLAHEFGHTLSLFGGWGHTNDAPSGFDSHNVMWVRELDVRDHFSLGQSFRLNLDTESVLNIHSIRSGPTRSCLTDLPSPSPSCPILALDWTRP